MSNDSKINAYTVLIGLIIGAITGAAVFCSLPLMGADMSERRPIAIFGEDVAKTLTPMLAATRDTPLTAADAVTIASLKETYDALQRNKSAWHEDTTPPDAPFFKTLAQYDADKMSAFKQTTLLTSARHDVNQFVDEAKAFNTPSVEQTVVLRLVVATVVALVIGFFGGLFAQEQLIDRAIRKDSNASPFRAH